MFASSYYIRYEFLVSSLYNRPLVRTAHRRQHLDFSEGVDEDNDDNSIAMMTTIFVLLLLLLMIIMMMMMIYVAIDDNDQVYSSNT